MMHFDLEGQKLGQKVLCLFVVIFHILFLKAEENPI